MAPSPVDAVVDLSQVESKVISVFDYLPENQLTSFIVRMNAEMSYALMAFIPNSWWSNFFLMNPLFFLIVFFVVAVAVYFIMDFAADAWKMPFAMLLDIMGIMALSYGYWMNAAAGVGSLIVFYLLVENPVWAKYAFGGAGAVKALVPVPALNILPINTALMLVATITDKGL
jgi:hypothetical protein